MEEELKEEARLRRYLLGELTLEERVSVEERLFLDDKYSQLARAVEDDLVDEYARHDLARGEREKFERNYLARPERREDLRIAQALQRFLDSQPEAEPAPAQSITYPAHGHGGAPPAVKPQLPHGFLSLFRRKPALGLSLAAAVLTILSVIAWLVFQSARRPDGGRPLQAQDPTPAPASPAPRKREPADGPPVNGTSRGGDVETAQRRPVNQDAPETNKRPGDDRVGQRPERPRSSPRLERPAPTGVATFIVLPGVSPRGEGQRRPVSVKADIGTVILRLPLTDENSYRSYRAELQTGGRATRTFDRLTAEVDSEFGKVVPVKIPAALLREQSYHITLSGITADGRARAISSHAFRVAKQ